MTCCCDQRNCTTFQDVCPTFPQAFLAQCCRRRFGRASGTIAVHDCNSAAEFRVLVVCSMKTKYGSRVVAICACQLFARSRARAVTQSLSSGALALSILNIETTAHHHPSPPTLPAAHTAHPSTIHRRRRRYETSTEAARSTRAIPITPQPSAQTSANEKESMCALHNVQTPGRGLDYFP